MRNENRYIFLGNQIYKNIFYNPGNQKVIKWDPHKSEWFDIHSNIVVGKINAVNRCMPFK